MPWEQEGPMAAAIGAANSFGQGFSEERDKQKEMAAAAARDAEQQRMNAATIASMNAQQTLAGKNYDLQKHTADLAEADKKVTPLPSGIAKDMDSNDPIKQQAAILGAAKFYAHHQATSADRDMFNAYTLASQRFGTGATDVHGRIPELQASAGYKRALADKTKQWKTQLQMQLDSRIQELRARGAIQQATNAQGIAARYLNAKALQSSSLEAREAIATATALNVANGKKETEAFSSAMSQYREAETTWRQQTMAAALAPSTAPAPGAEPNINMYLPQGQQSPSNISVVVNNPSTGKPEVVTHSVNTSNTRPPISGEIKKLQAANTPANKVRELLKADGYSDPEINAALGGDKPAAKSSGSVPFGLNLDTPRLGQPGFKPMSVFGQ